MKVIVMEYTNSNCKINLYKNHTWAFLASSDRLPDARFFTFRDLENVCRNQNSQWRHLMANTISDFLYDANSNVCIFQPIEKFDFENVGQGHWVQYSQLLHSIANISLHKIHGEHICASSYRLRYINILYFWTWKFRSRSCGRKTGLDAVR